MNTTLESEIVLSATEGQIVMARQSLDRKNS